MPVPLTDNWAYGNPMPAMPDTGGSSGGGGGGLMDLLGTIDWGGLAMTAATLADSRASDTQKIAAMMQINQQSAQKRSQELINQYGAEMASILDQGMPAADAQQKIAELTKSYASQGVPVGTLMKTAGEFMRFKQASEQSDRSRQEFQSKMDDREREERARKAMEMLTRQAPEPQNYAAGSFKDLGVGAPTGKPSEAPSAAAPGDYASEFDKWMTMVRRNSDIPIDKREKYITAVTGVDPALQRKTAAQQLLGGGAGQKQMSPTQSLAQTKMQLWNKYLGGGSLSQAEKDMLGIKDKDFTNMALRLMQSDPTMGVRVMQNPDAVVGGLQTMTGKLAQAMGSGGAPQQRGVPDSVMRIAGQAQVNKPFKADGKWYVKLADGSLRPLTPKSK